MSSNVSNSGESTFCCGCFWSKQLTTTDLNPSPGTRTKRLPKKPNQSFTFPPQNTDSSVGGPTGPIARASTIASTTLGSATNSSLVTTSSKPLASDRSEPATTPGAKNSYTVPSTPQPSSNAALPNCRTVDLPSSVSITNLTNESPVTKERERRGSSSANHLSPPTVGTAFGTPHFNSARSAEGNVSDITDLNTIPAPVIPLTTEQRGNIFTATLIDWERRKPNDKATEVSTSIINAVKSNAVKSARSATDAKPKNDDKKRGSDPSIRSRVPPIALNKSSSIVHPSAAASAAASTDDGTLQSHYTQKKVDQNLVNALGASSQNKANINEEDQFQVDVGGVKRIIPVEMDANGVATTVFSPRAKKLVPISEKKDDSPPGSTIKRADSKKDDSSPSDSHVIPGVIHKVESAPQSGKTTPVLNANTTLDSTVVSIPLDSLNVVTKDEK